MVKIMENPMKMDDLGVPLVSETPLSWAWICFLVGVFFSSIRFFLNMFGICLDFFPCGFSQSKTIYVNAHKKSGHASMFLRRYDSLCFCCCFCLENHRFLNRVLRPRTGRFQEMDPFKDEKIPASRRNVNVQWVAEEAKPGLGQAFVPRCDS